MLINGGVINGGAVNGDAGAARVFVALPSHWVATRYRCYLTGSENGLATDVELPISSFQTRLRSTLYSLLSCVIKGGDAYIDSIAARSHGKLKIYREYVHQDGSIDRFMMASASLETINQQSGGRAGMTITLTASGNVVPGSQQTLTLKNCTYYANDGTRRRYRCEIDPRLRPKDTININGDTIIVGEIIHIIDVKTAVMEIAEA